MAVAIQISPNDSLFIKDPQASSTGRNILNHAIPLMQEIGFEKFTFKKLAERVKRACDNVKMGNLTATLSNILPAVEGVTDITENRTSKNAEFVQKVADLNVEFTIEKIKSDSEILNEMYKNGEIAIVGAMYDVHTGKVTFMN